MNSFFLKNIERIANFFELAGIIVVLLMAFVFQLVLFELPCPLCILQRIGFLGIAFGFLLNFRFGFRPSHYSIILLSALYTSFVALRQIVLHVIPGTGAYGSAIFGLHMYTWSFILSMLIIIATSILLGFDRQYEKKNGKKWRFLTNLLFAIVTLIICANIVSIVLECGFQVCPDNPVQYELFDKASSTI